MDGKKEVRLARDPAPIRSQAAARHDAVNMRMMGEGLPPCVQDRHHAGLGAEVFGVRADDADRLGRRLEQDVVDERLVLKRDRRDRRGDGKDDMEIGDGQQFGAAIGQPLEARQTLTLRTVPVATGIVGDASLAAILAALDVTAERRRPAGLDRGHDLALIEGEPVALRGAEAVAVAAKDVRHLQLRAHPARLIRAGRPRARAGRRGSACWRSNGWRPARSAWSRKDRNVRAAPE